MFIPLNEKDFNLNVSYMIAELYVGGNEELSKAEKSAYRKYQKTILISCIYDNMSLVIRKLAFCKYIMRKLRRRSASR